MSEQQEKDLILNILDIFDIPESVQNQFWTLLNNFSLLNKWAFMSVLCHTIYDNTGYWAIGVHEREEDLSISYEVLDLLEGFLLEVYEFSSDELMEDDKARWELKLISKE